VRLRLLSGTADEIALNAARKGEIDTLWAALEIRSEAGDTERNDSRTPLHFAAESGHKKCVELVLHASAEKDAKEKESWTPLHLGARKGEGVRGTAAKGGRKDGRDRLSR
jgi:ankyrin repeat protein